MTGQTAVQWSLTIVNLDITNRRYNETSLGIPNLFVCVSPSWDPRCNKLTYNENLVMTLLLFLHLNVDNYSIILI